MNGTANDNGASTATNSRLRIEDEDIPPLFCEWDSFRSTGELHEDRGVDQILMVTLQAIRSLEESRGGCYVFVTESEEIKFLNDVDDIAINFVEHVCDTAMPPLLFHALNAAILAIAPTRVSIYVHRAANTHYRFSLDLAAMIDAGGAAV